MLKLGQTQQTSWSCAGREREVLGLVDLNKQIKTFVTQGVYDKLLVRSLAMPLQDWLRWLNATIP